MIISNQADILMSNQTPTVEEHGLSDSNVRLEYAKASTVEADDTQDVTQTVLEQEKEKPSEAASSTRRYADATYKQQGIRGPRSGSDTYVEAEQHVIEAKKSESKWRLLRRQRRLATLRHEVFTSRVAVRQERIMCAQQRGHAAEASKRWIEAVTSVMGKPNMSYDTAHLRSLYDQMRQLYGQLDGYSERLMKLEGRLSRLEYRLEQKEAEFCKDAYESVSDESSYFVDGDEYSMISTSEASSEEIDPRLRRYYDKVGDITVIEERLGELEFDYHQEMAIRDERMGLGEPVSPPEVEFQEAYEIERRGMLQELEEARVEAQRLREECLRNNLRPENSPGSGESKEFSHHLRQADNPLNQKGDGKVYGGVKALEAVRYSVTSTRNRILGWLRKLVPRAAPPTQEIPYDDQKPRIGGTSGFAVETELSQMSLPSESLSGKQEYSGTESARTAYGSSDRSVDRRERLAFEPEIIRARHSDPGLPIDRSTSPPYTVEDRTRHYSFEEPQPMSGMS